MSPGYRPGTHHHLDDIGNHERKCGSPKRCVEKKKVRARSKAGKE